MTSTNACQPCSRAEENIEANKWCTDCEEGLCDACAKAHARNKCTLGHSLIDTSLVISLPCELVKSRQICSKHPPFKEDLICANHDQVCCRSCMLRDHSLCPNVLPIETVAAKIKASNTHELLLNESKKVEQTLEKIKTFGKDNLLKVQEQDIHISKSIDAVKASFISSVEVVRKQLANKLSKTVETNVDKINTYKEDVRKLRDAAVIYNQEIDFIKKHASENKAFLLIERLKQDLHRDGKAMKEIASKVENVKLVFFNSGDFKIKSLGCITVENGPCDISYSPDSDIFSRPLDFTDQSTKKTIENDSVEEIDSESECIYEDIEKTAKEPSYVTPTGPYFNISPTEIKLDCLIVDNKTTKIWKGTFRTTKEVAVKINKTNAEDLKIQQLLKANNENIVLFYGAYADKGKISIVSEFMAHRDLVQFLQSGEGSTLHETELMSIAAQIARGMSYLESNGMVHCRLQGKKVLVGENEEIKLSGLEYCGIEKVVAMYPYTSNQSDELNLQKGDVITVVGKEDCDWWEGNLNGKRGFFPRNYVNSPAEYIRLNENTFKWYAPETIHDGRCDIKSNVWSYGVILVEIVTHGKIPYPGLKGKDVVSRLKHGYRHRRPNGCSNDFYKMMLKCWEEDPKERPSFEYLYNYLEDLLYDL